MVLTWTRRVTGLEVKGVVPGGRKRPGRERFVPNLERLEGRDCPTTLSVGPNLNISQFRDNQTEGTIAIDPTNPNHMFIAGMNWHGGYVGSVNGMPGMGLFASYSTTGGAGPWTNRFMATGGPGSDCLPMALGHPHAAFDNFGNLFLTYFTQSPLQFGTSTGSSANTLEDSTRTWGTNEWSTSGDGFVDVSWTDQYGGNHFQRKRILSNTATVLTVEPWDPNETPPAGAQYAIHLDAGAHTVVVAMSTDGGQTFSWLANFALSAGTTGPGTSYPDDQPNIATGPGGTVAAGSVWVQWQDVGVGSGPTGIQVAGAPVTGLGAVGAFSTPQSPSNSTGKRFGSIAVGNNGQLLLAYQSDLEMMSWPYHATVYSALDPDGLGASGFNAPVSAAPTNVMLQFQIPSPGATPFPNYPINAAADMAWDRSGGVHNGRVYLTYTDRPSLFSNDTNIFVRYSDNNGTTWSAPVQVNSVSTGNQFWPSIAVDQTTGNVAVVWYDPRNDPGNTRVQLYAAVSDDGGANFAVNNVAVAAALSKASGAEDHMRGTSTGGNSSRTLNDTTQNWATNWWGPYGAVPLTQVHIVAGTGYDPSGNPSSFYNIVGNSATQLVIDRDWAVVPDATSVYEFTLRYRYAYGGYTDVAFHNGLVYPIWADNSNSTLDNPDGANKPLDLYIAAITVNGGGQGPRVRSSDPAAPGENLVSLSLSAPAAFLAPDAGLTGLGPVAPAAATAPVGGNTAAGPVAAAGPRAGRSAAPGGDALSLVLPGTAYNALTLADLPGADRAGTEDWLLGGTIT